MTLDPLDVPSIKRDERLAGSIAIVTGAGSAGKLGGTGADIAILLAAKGARVVALDIDSARLEHTLEAIARVDGVARPFICDITDASACAQAAEFAQATYGPVDILVNNAAIAPGEQDNSPALWTKILDLNLTAAKTMSDVTLPMMKSNGRGSIIHISSIAGLRAGGGIGYSAAKGGMIAMAKAQAYEYGPYGIRVNTVAPGHVAIPMGLGFAGWEGANEAHSERTRLRRAKATLLGTEGTGWDVAYAVLYLAGDEAAYVTGHTIPVDGGTTQVFPIVMAETIERAGA